MKKILIGIVIVLVLIAIYAFGTYNSLVTSNVAADTQWKQVETNYQRRFDLIPNLVNSVKGIMEQEKDVFTAIANARAHYAGATTVDEKARAAGEVESALGRLLVITENYPQLRSSEAVQSLMAELVGTENRINVERMRFNEAIQAYNLKVMRFPSSVFASMFGFKERAYFEASAGAENAPQVQF